MKFIYEAVDAQGMLLRETLAAPNREEAIQKIQGMGYFPIVLDEIAGEEASPEVIPEAFSWRGVTALFGVPFKEIIYFTRRLATLHEAGLSIIRSLEILRRQFSGSGMGRMIGGMLQTVEEGGTLASAFSKYPRYFNTFYVSIVQAGEYGGHLEDSLRRLAGQLEVTQRRKKKLISALIYPAIIVIVSFTVVIIINAFVIPIFQKIYEEAKIPLPPLTLFVLTVNSWILLNWYWAFLFPMITSIASRGFLKNLTFRYYFHLILLKIPVLGMIIKKHGFSWFFRSLGTMLNSGVGIIESLNIVSKAIKNAVILKGVEEVSRSVYEGQGVAAAMGRVHRFDPYAVSMVEVGEQSGRLTEMLFSIADSYDEDLNTAYERMETLFTPVVTVVLAVVVGFIVVALFLPYLNYIQKLTSGNLF